MNNLESFNQSNQYLPEDKQEALAPKDFPIKPGEIFDAEAEFKELKKYHGDLGLEKLADFKEKLKYQKEGIAEIEIKLLPLIESNDLPLISEMEKLVAPEIEKYGFAAEFREKMGDFLKEVLKRAKNIKKAVADCLNESGEVEPGKLFAKLFNRPPLGEIKVEVDNLSIYFRIKDDEDFAYVASGAYKRKRNVNDRDREMARSSGGISLSDYSSAKLRGAVLIESPSYYDNEDFHISTKFHEKQHSLNYLLRDVELSDQEAGLKKLIKIKNTFGEILTEDELFSFALMFTQSNPKIESSIKDEISAYFSGGFPSSRISSFLLNKETLYDYGFFYDLPDPEDSDSSFKSRYMKLVEGGIIAFASLLDKGYSHEAAHAILFTEPLAFWLRVADRMGGKKLDSKSFKELEKKYISPEIVAEIEKVRQYELEEDEQE